MLTGVLCGCRLTGDLRMVTLKLPAVPAGPAPETWELEYRERAGEPRRILTVDKGTVDLLLPRDSVVAVLAAALSEGFRRLPAGAVVRRDSPSGVELTWLDGASASRLDRLARAGIPPDRVNIRRFLEESVQRSGGDPWSLDEARLMNDITGGKLKTVSFRLREEIPVDRTVPPGLWVPANALRETVDARDGRFRAVLPTGRHGYYQEGTRLTLVLQVLSGEVLLVVGP